MKKSVGRAAALVVLAVCSVAACSASTDTSETSLTTRPSDACAVTDLQPAWPSSGALTGGATADAPSAARSFVARELGTAGVATTGGLDVTRSGCVVRVSVEGLAGNVGFGSTPGGYVPSTFNLGGDAGLSIQVRGRHMAAAYASECGSSCSSFEMHVRYGEVVAGVTPQPDSTMELDLSGDPSVTGGYVFVARAADGSIRYALATAIHAGDFAAS